jgi:hypothetical protein
MMVARLLSRKGGERLESLILPAIVMCFGSAVLGFILGHNKGFSDGFDYAVQNSKEVGNEIAKNMVKEGSLRIYKIEKDGTFNPVEEKPDSVEENS